MANDAAPTPRPPDAAPAFRKVVVPTIQRERIKTSDLAVALVATVVSIVAHVVLFLLLMNVNIGVVNAGASAEDVETETKVEEPQKEEADLTNPDIGLDPSVRTNYITERMAEVSVPGVTDPTAAVGIANAESGPPMTLPPPPGSNSGTGGAPTLPDPGKAPMVGDIGGYGGKFAVNPFGGRSSSSREKMLQEGGGTTRSEAAVARGLQWLAYHQGQGGQWSLDGFNRHAREKLYPEGKTFTDDCTAMGTRRNDIAGTAFGLLPFLAAGQTHKPLPVSKDKKAPQFDYHKCIDGGLKFLISKQGKDGYFGGDMYAHCLAAIAMCEAYGLTSDPVLKVSAQKAINYIVDSQDPSGGGWRYLPRTPGDTSVTGWALMALKSGQMAGLSVPAPTLRRVERFIDSVEGQSKGGYVYQSGREVTPSMTAVALLCRQYLGVNPRNPGLLAGVELLKKSPPGSTKNLYYEYYATQVMHHMGGESWSFWNEGPDHKSGIRDSLINKQDQGTSGKKGNAGSWEPTDEWTMQGGRLMATSLSLLTLEVYYRHLPLYRRDLGVMKAAMK
jgi:hypothetical protein